MGKLTRRQFLAGTIAVGATMYRTELPAARRFSSLSDRVTLGNSGISVSYLSFGTGTIGWNKQSNQTRLGTVAFARMARHALDLGINYFDLADIYGSHQYLRAAMTGIPRDEYVVQTKIWYRTSKGAKEDLDRFLRELRTDYIDILMLHAVSDASWAADLSEMMDFMESAKEKKLIRAHGVSTHGLEPVKTAAATPWVDVALVRINHSGAKMSVPPSDAVPVIEDLHRAGKGVVGMKILGEGTIVEERQASLEFVLGLECVDSIVIGFESREQIDDILRRGQAILNA